MNNKILIKNILRFIAASQEKNGSFLSFTSADPVNFKNPETHRTTFFTALTISCLENFKNEPLAKAIIPKAVKFLLSQKSEHWSFNYWSRNSQESKSIPYPDDLDDTFCALSTIYKHNPKIIDGAALAKIVAILTATEKQEGGPYRTWLVPENSPEIWKDIDLAVNSNIAYFLSLQDINLENMEQLIESAIETKKYRSPYYTSPHSVIYFISRFYKGGKSNKIIEFLIKNRRADGSWGNPLDSALALSSLLNLEYRGDIKKSVDYLIKYIEKGALKNHPFGIELIKNETTYYSGSPALTAAFCLEALVKAGAVGAAVRRPADGRSITARSKEKPNKKESIIYNKIIAAAKKRFTAAGPELKKQSLKFFGEIIEKSANKQIALLPYFFRGALGKKREEVSDELIINLGVVNAYGWLAYTIYDNFLDDDGDPAALSVANFCLRELSLIYTDVAKKYGRVKIFNKIMTGIDSANSWELKYCRGKIDGNILIPPNPLPDYKNYSKLAERSLGHALGPITILLSLGYKHNSKEIKNILAFFNHYIIARQLNDDAHDWEEDLKKGHISAANTLLLKKLGKTGKEIDLKKDLPKLQSVYWNDVILDICDGILKQIKKAGKILNNISTIENKSILESMLEPIESSARTAIAEQQKTTEFLENYKV